MSKILHLTMGEADVARHCRELGVAVSAINRVSDEVVLLVCKSVGGAELMRFRMAQLADAAAAKSKEKGPPIISAAPKLTRSP